MEAAEAGRKFVWVSNSVTYDEEIDGKTARLTRQEAS